MRPIEATSGRLLIEDIVEVVCGVMRDALVFESFVEDSLESFLAFAFNEDPISFEADF